MDDAKNDRSIIAICTDKLIAKEAHLNHAAEIYTCEYYQEDTQTSGIRKRGICSSKKMNYSNYEIIQT